MNDQMEQTLARLTNQEYLVLQHMNQGMYLVKEGKVEGLAFANGISNILKAGTAKSLLEAGLIRQIDFEFKGGIVKYLLTDEGRKYRKVK